MLFSNVYVSDEIKKRLILTVKNQRVSHAQLFLGSEGTHTLGLAIAYAQYINCKHRSDNDACGVCESCKKYQQLAHPDLHFFFPNAISNSIKKDPKSYDYYTEWREMVTSTNALFTLNEWYQKIEIENKQAIINTKDVEDLLYKASMKPYEAEYKVFIIWMIEKLRFDAATKLLKTLEEPDGKTLFIMITENHDKILKTILSRTQLLKVNKLSTTQLVDVLIQEKKYDIDKANYIALSSDNNLILAMNTELDEEAEHQNLNLFVSFMRLAYQLAYPSHLFDFSKIIDCVAEMESLGREKQKDFLRYAIAFIRNNMLLDYQLDDLLKISKQEQENLLKFKNFINKKTVSFYYKLINDAILHIESNVNTKMVFTDLLFSISNILLKYKIA